MKLDRGRWSNWSGGVTCKPRRMVSPQNEVELAAAIRSAEGTVRVPGSGHSFTPLCASDDELIDLSSFSGLKSAAAQSGTATFLAATPLWAVGPALHSHGLALKNMGDIDRQTLAGAVSTGTHGTGRSLGSFSSDVRGFRLVLANGGVLNCSTKENAEIFAAGRLALGMFGVLSEITIAVRPNYRLTEDNFLMNSADLFRRLDDLVSSNRHFEFFWFPYSDAAVCKVLNETDRLVPEPRSSDEMRRRGARYGAADRVFAGINAVLPALPFLLRPTHGLISRMMPKSAGARWSYEIFPSPRPVRFNEMEYAVPIERAADCLRELVSAIRGKNISTGFPLEFRSVAADDVWLSPFYRRDSATIAIHQYHRIDTTELFEAGEAIFRVHGGRPHWGKRHTRSRAELVELYPAFERFIALRRDLDPKGKFLNFYLKTMFE